MLDLARRPLLLAAELSRAGAGVVVVGGATRRLRTGRGYPRDLDVAVMPGAVIRLVTALAALRVPAELAALIDRRELRFATGWGPLDVFVGTPPTSKLVLVEGAPVAVETLR